MSGTAMPTVITDPDEVGHMWRWNWFLAANDVVPGADLPPGCTFIPACPDDNNDL